MAPEEKGDPNDAKRVCVLEWIAIDWLRSGCQNCQIRGEIKISVFFQSCPSNAISIGKKRKFKEIKKKNYFTILISGKLKPDWGEKLKGTRFVTKSWSIEILWEN